MFELVLSVLLLIGGLFIMGMILALTFFLGVIGLLILAQEIGTKWLNIEL